MAYGEAPKIGPAASGGSPTEAASGHASGHASRRADASDELHWLHRVLTRHLAPLIALLPIVLAVAAIALLGDGERESKPTDTIPSGSSSAQAEELAVLLPETDDTALLVLTADSPFTSSLEQQLRSLVSDVGASGNDALVVAEDRTAAIAPVPLVSSEATEQTKEIEALRAELANSTPEGVDAAVTGPAAVTADLIAVFDGANTRLLLATALVVALLLVITYRSPVLWVIPLVVIGVADRLAAVAGTQVMATLDVAFDGETTGILSILVFGAGTDYALLLISRYRSELALHESRYTAMAIALRRTAEAVFSSAATVALGVLTLLLSLTPSTRALGVASAIGIAVASMFVLVVLPAALVCFGRWVFWPRAPRYVEALPHAGDKAQVVEDSGIWARIGRLVARRPKVVVVASLAVVTVLATGTLSISLGLDGAEAFKDAPESVVAAERLTESFPAGTSDPVQVLTKDDADTVTRALADLDGVDSARVAYQGGGISQIEVVLAAAPGSDDAQESVRAMRTALEDYTDTAVGGTEALSIDKADSTRRDLLVIVPTLVVLVIVLLAGLLRSVVAPVVLVATVVATYLAALGASWWVFGLLGYDGLETGVPLIAFVFLVALGVDYNIFLVTRAREESATRGTREGMLHALAATGGVITSAGILLAAVFTVLGQLPAVGLAEIGIVICIGVLLDTLLIRTVLVPAIALLLGDRFWWPRVVGPEPASRPRLDPNQGTGTFVSSKRGAS